MSERTEKCDCGQVTHLVTIAGIECYDPDIHGSNAPANGKCFNCFKPFAIAEPAVTEPPDDSGKNTRDISEMTVKELKVFAAAQNPPIELPKRANKAEIAELIESELANRLEEDTGEKDPGDDDTGDDDDVD